MKPFNLKEATEGKPLRTRAGIKVTLLGVIPANVDYPVIGYKENGVESESWTTEGRYHKTAESPNNHDLIMDTVETEGWIAYGKEESLNADGIVALATHVWPTEEEAKRWYRDANFNHEPKGTVRVSWEE